MGVEFKIEDNAMVAFIEGEIDHHTAKSIREKIDFQINKLNPSVLEMDFGKVKFMDSSGIGLVMGRYKIMKTMGGKVKIINIPPHISRIMKLSGLGVLGLI